MPFMTKQEVLHEIARYCSQEFFVKYSEQIYRCYRREYEVFFDDAFDFIGTLVEQFKDFYGEE